MCSHRAGKVCFKDGTIRASKSASVGPGEIKRREVVLDPQVSPEEIKSMAVELGLRVGFFFFSCIPAAELQTLSL